MPTEREQLQQAIAALEAQRGVLGDSVVDAALGSMRRTLAALGAVEPHEPEQKLKQVSILFLDMVGSTTLSQHLDPEEIHAVIDDALARCTRVVLEHQGKVLQYAGDSLLAVFGAEQSHEDDAERAVHCGLGLLAQGRALQESVRAAHGHSGFGVRVGIHTGAVLLGGGVDAEGSIRGLAVNIAARMEQTAPAGALRISHDTYALVRGLFEVQAQEPLAVKGVDVPVHSVLVHRAKPRAFRIPTRGIEGVATRMIGRELELQTLQLAFAELYTERRLARVTVVAEAGVGKSRLLYEFEVWSETRPEKFYLFRGRAHPHSQSQPYGLLRDILAWRFQIADDDSLAAAKTKLEQGLMPLLEPEDGADLAEGQAHLLGHLIGLDYSTSRHVRGILGDAQQIRNRAFHAVAQMFRRTPLREGWPIVLELEDLHWADDASLDLLDLLATVDADVPMLIVGLARPSLFERRPDWPRGSATHRRVDLAPLDAGHSRDLVLELLKKLPDVPEALREMVIGGAEGNPFYMEELVKMLVDQGAIETAPERWTLHLKRLLATQVPATLTGVLQARLDGLPALERRALQEASVVGAVFWDQALGALDPAACDALPPLVRRELVLPRPGGTLEGLREYSFRHHLLHQVTYGTVLKRRKRELHGKLAHWMSQLTGARARDFLGLTAEHYEKAGDSTNAVEFHARAAAYARERFAHDAALDHVQRALALLGGSAHPAELRWRLHDVRERTFNIVGRRDEQRHELETLQQLADVLDDDTRRAEVARRVSFLGMRLADWPLQESAARRAMALADKLQDHEGRLRGQRLLCAALADLGDTAGAKALAERGLAESRACGFRHVEAQFCNTLFMIAVTQGDLMGGLRMNQLDLAICQELGDRQSEAVVFCNIGESWLDLGDLAQARRHLDESLKLLRSVGERAMECPALADLAQLALWQGDDAQALQLARMATDIAVSVQAPDYEAKALVLLGNAELALGDVDAAHAAFTHAQSLARELGYAGQHDAGAGLARVALARSDLAGALRHTEVLLEHLRGGGRFQGAKRPRLILANCQRVLALAQDPRAAEVLGVAHDGLMACAHGIADPALRQGFLENIPEHREIRAAWAAALAGATP